MLPEDWTPEATDYANATIPFSSCDEPTGSTSEKALILAVDDDDGEEGDEEEGVAVQPVQMATASCRVEIVAHCHVELIGAQFEITYVKESK